MHGCADDGDTHELAGKRLWTGQGIGKVGVETGTGAARVVGTEGGRG